ncbi:hypothetical protein ABZP36_009284 [Zizania latifolia]
MQTPCGPPQQVHTAHIWNRPTSRRREGSIPAPPSKNVFLSLGVHSHSSASAAAVALLVLPPLLACEHGGDRPGQFLQYKRAARYRHGGKREWTCLCLLCES